jgi:hypothetical protein
VQSLDEGSEAGEPRQITAIGHGQIDLIDALGAAEFEQSLGTAGAR